MLAIGMAHAEIVNGYSVEINGAGPLTPLLSEYLEISRHTDTSIDTEELQRLVGIAPRQIRDLLATEGYFSPVVEHTLTQQNGRWVARFTLDIGAPTLIDAVDIRFTGDIAANPKQAQRINRLRRQWSLDPGERFRQDDWSEAKNTVLKGLLNRDYPAAQLADSEARIDPEQRSAQLSAVFDSGPAFTFGELEINGLQRYSRDRIERLNPIEPGEPYSQEKLNELQSRVQDSGYFRSAFATVEVDPAHPQRVPVRLDLTENERKRLALGIGFSTDSGPRGQVKWLDRNFLGRDWRLESELKLDRQSRLVGGEIFLPAISNGWMPSYGAHYERTDIENVINDKIRTSARLTSPDKADEQSWAIQYFADRQHIEDIPINNRQALVASYNYTMRRIDNLIAPRRGYVAGIELAAGPRGFLNEEHLGRAVVSATWLHPFQRRWQAVLRGRVGQVFGADRDTVPEDLLFRTGGDQSVRGYAYNSLGVAAGDAIVGGTVLAVVSAELVYRITSDWGAAIFADAGNAADSWNDFKLQRGSGVGARWRSPIGPVNLDLAYGHDTGDVRLHFSIGYGF